jgi:undecaprenyl-diphosphatase
VGAHRDDRLIDALLARRRQLLWLAAGLLAAILLLDLWLHVVGPLPGERAVGRWWVHWRPWQDLDGDQWAAVDLFDVLATPYVAVATVAIAAGVTWENLGPRWAVLVGASSGVVVLTATLKQVLGASPLWSELGRHGLNYPSGHVAYATSLGGCLALIGLWRGQRTLVAAALLVIVLMGPQRVVARTHLPSDVIAGYAAGIAWLSIVITIGLPWVRRHAGPPALPTATGDPVSPHRPPSGHST